MQQSYIHCWRHLGNVRRSVFEKHQFDLEVSSDQKLSRS